MFNLGVALLPQLLPATWAGSGAAAIVIDTLRFTTTACVALEAGARSIEVLSDIQSARQLAAASQPPKVLCGERLCQRIAGFDLGNSPLEYGQSVVHERDLIFSTTNGTVAVEAAAAAKALALGSLLNRRAVAQWISAQSLPDVWLVCAGTDGHVAAEDVLTAGAISDHLLSTGKAQLLNDAAMLARDAWQQVSDQGTLLDRLQNARGGRNLIQTGFGPDVQLAARLDVSACVPVRSTSGFFVRQLMPDDKG